MYHASVVAYSHGNAYGLSFADSDAFVPADGLSNEHVPSCVNPSASSHLCLHPAFPAA
ncbi:MAG: hypothetical protein C1O27_002477 [Chloroflexi bacterium]|nr:MAG: hypothetical protein C1O27_002477 [Chloroflexota bacterium]